MLLKEIKEPFNSDKYLYEIKFDGIRALIFASPKKIEIVSRNNEVITNLYPELQSLKEIVTKEVIFDGELVQMEQGKPSFKALSQRHHLKDITKIKEASIINPIIYMAFDILYENKNLIDYPLIKRKELLASYQDTNTFIKVTYIKKEGIKLFKTIKKLQLEGIVAKKIDSIYEISTRTNNWLKIKNIKTSTFLIGGYIDKSTNHVITILLGKYKKQDFIFMGKVSIGKKHPLYNILKKQKISQSTPFSNYQDKEALYIKPQLSISVSYLNLTNNNRLRHPFIP